MGKLLALRVFSPWRRVRGYATAFQEKKKKEKEWLGSGKIGSA